MKLIFKITFAILKDIYKTITKLTRCDIFDIMEIEG